MSTRLMYDSVDPMAIPETAQMVLVYVDGIYAKNWRTEAARERFKYAQKVTCSAIGVAQAQVYDVEPECIWPIERVGPLVKRDWDQGLDPTVYLNERNHWHAARDYFRRTYGREPQWFVANYDGDPSIPDGAVAKQYAHPADPPGSIPSGPWELPFHADVSAVRAYWPGVDTQAPGGGGGKQEEALYAFDVQEIPAHVGENGDESDTREVEIVWPPLDGATALHEAWVAGFVPAGATARFHFAHWNTANGVRLDGPDGLNYLGDDTTIQGPAALPGKLAPDGASKLVLVYQSTHELKFTVEVRD